MLQQKLPDNASRTFNKYPLKLIFRAIWIVLYNENLKPQLQIWLSLIPLLGWLQLNM